MRMILPSFIAMDGEPTTPLCGSWLYGSTSIPLAHHLNAPPAAPLQQGQAQLRLGRL